MDFGSLGTAFGVSKINDSFFDKSYIDAYTPSHADVRIFSQLGDVGSNVERRIWREVAKLQNDEVEEDVDLSGSDEEDVKKLDVVAYELFINLLRSSYKTRLLASEEDVKVINIPKETEGKYIVAFDLSDGSFNIDHLGSIESIFAIHRRNSDVLFTKDASQSVGTPCALRLSREIKFAPWFPGAKVFDANLRRIRLRGDLELDSTISNKLISV